MARLHTKILHWGNKHDGPNTYKEGRQGGLEDAYWEEDELVDYYRPRGKRRKSGVCKKSKAGEKCDFSAKTVHGTTRKAVYGYDENGNYARIGWEFTPRVINCCSRCGKYDWSRHSWSYLY